MSLWCLIGIHKWRPLFFITRPRSKYEKGIYKVHTDRCIRKDCGLTKTYVVGAEGIPPPGHPIFKEADQLLKKLNLS